MFKTSAIKTMSSLQQGFVQSATRMNIFQQRVQQCNNLPSFKIIPFHIQGIKVGEVSEDTARMLCEYSDVFCTSLFNNVHSLQLIDTLNNSNSMERSSAIATVTFDLKQKGIVKGWRNELISVVSSSFNQKDLFFKIERAAYPLFGIVGYGIHVNGYVNDSTVLGGKKLWIGTRSKNKQTFPGLKDHIVAGQISEGLLPSETLIKECEEEAGILKEIAIQAISTSCISYRGIDLENNQNQEEQIGIRLKRDIIYCYDLELSSDFIPKPMDGEVEKFELLDLEQICQIIEGSISNDIDKEEHIAFKPNCILVILDFMIRCGYISSDSPGYFNLVSSLRREI